MYKQLATIFTLLLCHHSIAFADYLDADTIKKIHEQTKNSVVTKCLKEMSGVTNTICNCLADKVEMNLNDNDLRKCVNNENGSTCISNAVADAAAKGMDKINLTTCSQPSAEPVATTQTQNNNSTKLPSTSSNKTIDNHARNNGSDNNADNNGSDNNASDNNATDNLNEDTSTN